MRRSDLLVVAIGRVLTAALALLGFVILTRLLAPEEYALIALLNAFMVFAGLILINPAGQWVNRHIHEWHADNVLWLRLMELRRMVSTAAIVTGVLAITWSLVVRQSVFTDAIGVGVAIAAAVYFSTMALSYASVLNSLDHRLKAVVWQLATNGMGLLVATLFVQMEAKAGLWLAGLATGTALSYGGVRAALKRMIGVPARATTSAAQLHRTFFLETAFIRYALSLTTVTVLMWLEGNGYRFVLERVWSAHSLGLFLMALSIPAQLTAVLENFVMQYAYPYYYRRISRSCDELVIAQATSAMTNALMPLYFIWGACLFLLAPQFLFLVAGPAYYGAAKWIALGVLLEVARLTGNAWLLSSQANKNFRPMIAPFALGAVGSLLASLIVVAFDSPAIIFAGGIVAAALAKAGFIALRARRMMAIRVSLKRTALSGLLLVSGFVLHGVAMTNYGHWVSLAIVFMAGLMFLVLGYLHLRTVADFRELLREKLSQP